VNSPEDGPVGPKHVEIRQYINRIEIVTSVGFYSICTGMCCHHNTCSRGSESEFHFAPLE